MVNLNNSVDTFISVYRLARPSLVLDCTHLMWNVVRWEFLQHLTGKFLYAGLPGLPRPAPAVLRLDADDGAERLIGQVGLVGDVSVGVEPKNLQTGRQRFEEEAAGPPW